MGISTWMSAIADNPSDTPVTSFPTIKQMGNSASEME
jgi:hypothetical protein